MEEKISENTENSIKKKIAIIIDQEGWAFYNTAQQIKKHLSNYYNIDVIPMDIFEGNIVKVFVLSKNYNLTHFMWRGHISWVYSDFAKEYISSLGYTYEEFEKEYIKNNSITTAVYDHLFLNEEGKELTEYVCNNSKAYMVSSKKLEKIYKEYSNIKNPTAVIADGVDLELFNMKNNSKYDNWKNRPIIIGWSGNSKFLDEQDDDLKGLNKVIKPAIEELQKEGYNIQLNIADRNIKMIPHEQMPEYYNNIDIYVCASRTEGTPNTVLEAMACGVPVISTDVGIVPEAFGEKQKQYIIKRDKDSLKEKLIELIKNKQNVQELSRENQMQIQEGSWTKQCEKFRKFFEENL